MLVITLLTTADSLNATFVGVFPYGLTTSLSVDTDRGILFLPVGSGVEIYSLFDPRDPALIGLITVRDLVADVAYDPSDSTLYLALRGIGVEAYDLKNPLAPEKVWEYVLPCGGALGIDVRDGTLALAAYNCGTLVFRDFSLIGVHPGTARDVVFVDTLIASLVDENVEVFAPSDPSSTLHLLSGPYRSVASRGSYLLALRRYARSGMYVDVFRVLPTLSYRGSVIPENLREIWTHGNLLLGYNYLSGTFLYAYSLSDPESPVSLWSEGSSYMSLPGGLATYSGIVYVALSGYFGDSLPVSLLIFEDSTLLSGIPSLQSITFALSGDYMYVGTYRGIAVVDVGDVSSPRLVRVKPTDRPITDLEVAGDALVAHPDGSDTLLVYSLYDPSDPSPASTVYAPLYGGDMESLDTLLFVPGSGIVLNLSDPSSPVVDTVLCSGCALDLWDTLLAVGYVSGMGVVKVLNAADPSYPMVDSATFSDYALSITSLSLTSHHLVLSYQGWSYPDSTVVLSLSPLSPLYRIPGGIAPAEGVQDYVISVGSGGAFALSPSDSLSAVAYYGSNNYDDDPVGGDHRKIRLKDGNLFVGTAYKGIHILRFRLPLSVAESPVMRTRFVREGVYDVSGRKVGDSLKEIRRRGVYFVVEGGKVFRAIVR